jgi:hypothetical protein
MMRLLAGLRFDGEAPRGISRSAPHGKGLPTVPPLDALQAEMHVSPQNMPAITP